MQPTDVAVIGTGSYGTCLAILFAASGHRVTLWGRNRELVRELAETRVNKRYLPGHKLPAALALTSDLEEAVSGARIVLAVTPSHAAREVLSRACGHFGDGTLVVNASKGLEEESLARVDQIYAEIFSEKTARTATYLSGPTFAKEIAAGLPAAIVLAGRDPEATRTVQEALSTDRFRVYSSDDVVGVQVGGALKNVIAICAGISDGLGYGHNARAALITRGLAEISRVGAALGANPLTFAGLSGMGDLVLTCAGDLSRNRRVGLGLGQGKRLDEIVADMGGMVAEGVKTTRVARDLARRIGVEAPLTEYAYGVLYEGKPADRGVGDLMSRSLKSERG
jgi:glycerol-3-phosphate dehydrogenase (NAD(P)+)